MKKKLRSVVLGVLAAVFVISAAPAQELEQLERRVASVQGQERLMLLAELLELARTKPLGDVSARGLEALSLLQAHPDPALELEIRLDLSWCASRAGDKEAGLEHAEQARELALELNDESGVAVADYHRALAHWYRAENDEAIAAARLACTAQEALGETEDLMSTWTLLGAIHRARSAHDEALDCHLEALELARQSDDASAMARSRNNIGLVYWDIDEYGRAKEFLAQAVPVFRELGEEAKLAPALNNLGLIFIELGEPAGAIPYLKEGLALYERLGQRRGKARLYSNLGYANEKLGQENLALDYNLQALALREELGDQSGLARSLGSIAGLHHRAHRYKEAVEFYNRAAQAADRSGARDELSQIQLGIAGSYEALGEFELALSALRRHQEVVQDLKRAESIRRIAELESRAELQAQERELDEQRAQHEHELEHQESRLALLAILSLVFLIGLGAFAHINRGRAKALAALRQSHESLKGITQRLGESEERYRTVFEDAIVPKLLLDLEESLVVDANGPAALLCGREREDLLDSSLAELEPSWLAQIVAPSARTEDCHVQEWRDETGSVRHSEIWLTPLSLAGRSCAVVTVYDVTERRKVEEDRIRFERLDSIGLLAGGIAHDFNNALTSVLGYISLARIEDDEVTVGKYMANAEAGVHQATSLTHQLIAFARGGEPHRRLQDVKKLLSESVQFSLSGSNVRVDFDVSPDLWAAELDGVQFKQVVSNLVINAIHAMPDGGRLRVCARNLHVDTELTSSAGPGRYLRIDFEDEGHGIPVDVQDRILDPYFTTKDHGSGLGLSTAFAIVSRHGGWVDFKSREGEGTTFSLYYPASVEIPTSHEEEGEVEFNGSGSILVMDDDPSIHGVFRASLAELGYEVEIVEDGEAALRSWFSAMAEGRPFDAVIMDLTVPGGMGGKEAMAELRRRDPDAVGIVISGYSKDPVMSDCQASGFAGALPKPFNVANLGKLLRRVVPQHLDESDGSRLGSMSHTLSSLDGNSRSRITHRVQSPEAPG